MGVGDRVRLRSGSPDLLIVDIACFDVRLRPCKFVVAWRDESGCVQETITPLACLAPVKAS